MSIGMFLLTIYSFGIIWVFVQMVTSAKRAGDIFGPISVAACLAGALTWPLLVLSVLLESFKSKPGGGNG